MLKYRMRFVILALAIFSAASSTVSADTWRLENGQSWKGVSAENQDKFLIEVAEAKKLVNTGQTKAARKAFDTLKKDFPEITGPDLDIFIKAELLLSQKKLTKSARTYDKLLADYPKSKLRQAALDRQFAIGSAYLSGQKKVVLGIIPIAGYAEGIRIMEKITDRADIDSAIGIQAAIAVAKNYEKREKFNEAYLKWWEISSQWQSGVIGRDALLGMAQAKHAQYNKQTEHKRHFYDASCLRSARSYYERFKLLFPKDAETIGVGEILHEITEQLAFKEFRIGRYYQRTGNQQSASLYADMVISDWPDSQAAEMAKEMLTANFANEEIRQ